MYFSSQQVDFNTTFYSSPAVLVSVHHYYNRQVNHLIPQENNIITAWVEVDITIFYPCYRLVQIRYIVRLGNEKNDKTDIENLLSFSEVDLTSMRICVKDMSGTGRQHDPLSVSYVVIGGSYYFVFHLDLNKRKFSTSITSLLKLLSFPATANE